MSRKVFAKASAHKRVLAQPQSFIVEPPQCGAWMEPDSTKPNTQRLFLYGVVGDHWDGFTSEQVVRLISGMSGQKLVVHVNSLGGGVWEGIAIYFHLLAYPGEVDMVIDGIAASIASLFAMAADTVKMPDTSMLMIHNPWTVTAGEADDLRADADLLDKVRDTCVNAYAAKSGKSREEVIAIMKATTYYTSAEAVAEGFADEEITRDGVAARIAALDLSSLDMSKAPQSLRALAHSPASRRKPVARSQRKPRGETKMKNKGSKSVGIMALVVANMGIAYAALAVDAATGTELKSQMAEISGLSTEDVDAVLDGTKTDISMEQVDNFAFVLDTDVASLMSDAGPQSRKTEPPADPIEAFAQAVQATKLCAGISAAAFREDPAKVVNSLIKSATEKGAEDREADVMARAKDIKGKCRQAGKSDMAMELFLEGLSPEETRDRLFKELSSQQRIDNHLTPGAMGGPQAVTINTSDIYAKRRKVG